GVAVPRERGRTRLGPVGGALVQPGNDVPDPRRRRLGGAAGGLGRRGPAAGGGGLGGGRAAVLLGPVDELAAVLDVAGVAVRLDRLRARREAPGLPPRHRELRSRLP